LFAGIMRMRNKAEKLKKHWDIKILVKRFLTVSEPSQTYALHIVSLV